MSKTVDPTDFPYLRIAACSYEGSIFGWKVEENVEQMEMSATLTFGFNASIGALKCIACSQSGKNLVVGGMDERIRIYDMHSNKALGELSQHTGAVTSLKFFGDSYLISASEDFNLCIWRVYDWQCVHILGGHKDTIHDFSIHPTGKMALSASKDGTLKLWNLVQGRCAFTRRLKSPTDQVVWHDETGDYYMLVSARDIQLYKAADNSCLATHTHGSRINRACFTRVTSTSGNNKSKSTSTSDTGASEWRMVTVCDNKTVNVFDFEGNQTACVDLSPLGCTRPRDVYSVSPNGAAVQDADMREVLQAEHPHCCLVVATSTGQILVLSANNVERLGVSGAGADAGEELAVGSCVLSSHQVKAEPRLTAVVSWNPAAAAVLFAAKGNKRPRSILDCDVRADDDADAVAEEDAESLDSAPQPAKATTSKAAKKAKSSASTSGDANSSVSSSKKDPKPVDMPPAAPNNNAGKNAKNNKNKSEVAVSTAVKSTTKSADKEHKAPVAAPAAVLTQKDSSAGKKVKPSAPAESSPAAKKAKFTKAASPSSAQDPEEHDANKVVSFYTEERKPKGNDKFKKGKGSKNKDKGGK